jgi:mRNA-degrading endonuclease RelE of RelBE toxin-antitoxin system
MAYSLLVDQRVVRWLRNARLSSRHLRKIAIKLFELGVTPRPRDCRALVGGYRVDSGGHRIYYRVDDQERAVTVLLVGPANDEEFQQAVDTVRG